ncbi:unnamed protein product [Trichobilharzia regenti]|nr:unnamed protein product [Trichobilharzia regenti]
MSWSASTLQNNKIEFCHHFISYSPSQGAQTVSTNPSNDSQIIMSSKPLPPLPETEQSVAAGEEENIQSNVGNVTDKQRGNKAHK